MDKIVDQFIGIDPILGDQAKDDLIKYGEKSLDLVIDRFGSLSKAYDLQIRLSQLFGHFGDASVDRLMDVFKTGDFFKMSVAAYCFSNLNEEPAGSELVKKLSSGINTERCSIDALGFLGAKDWSFRILDLFNSNSGYVWEKLSYNAVMALFRFATKEDDQKFVSSRLSAIESFYKIAGDDKFKDLCYRNGHSLDVIFSDFKPVASDDLIRYWFPHENPVFQRLAAKALGWMRLKRTVNALRNHKSISNNDFETKKEIAHALAQIQDKEAANAIVYIYSTIDEKDPGYKSICLSLAICLDKIEDKKYVEKIYPRLLKMGGEIAAHTYYNLGLMSFEEEVWSDAINSEDYVIRGAVAPVYARLKGTAGITRLLQMERESSNDIERIFILSSLINAGLKEKYNDLCKTLVTNSRSYNLRMFRYPWKREVIVALRSVEEGKGLAVWENLFGIDSGIALEELMKFGIKIVEAVDQKTQQVSSPIITNKSQIKIFISYAHEDEKTKKELVDKHLKAIQNHYDDSLLTWNDDEIKPGINWDNKIKKEIEEADIIIFLITNSFLASGYIKNTEIQNALQLFSEKKQIIVPIYIEEVRMELFPFAEKQYLPGVKPLKDYKPQNKGWVKIQKGIIKLIKDIKEGNTAEYFE